MLLDKNVEKRADDVEDLGPVDNVDESEDGGVGGEDTGVGVEDAAVLGEDGSVDAAKEPEPPVIPILLFACNRY